VIEKLAQPNQARGPGNRNRKKSCFDGPSPGLTGRITYVVVFAASFMYNCWCWSIIAAAYVSVASAISCLDEMGAPVAWFIAFKLPNGGRYVYADARVPYFVVRVFLFSARHNVCQAIIRM
jgi:hypothetical protein